MKISGKTTKPGFLLMEAILALAIFCIVITGIVSALSSTASLVNIIRSERWIQKQQQNILIEILTTPATLEEFQEEKVIPLQEFDAQAFVRVEPLQIENQNGDILRNLYEIEIRTEWQEGYTTRESTLTTTHYYPLYQR